jgi:hypothetical protein
MRENSRQYPKIGDIMRKTAEVMSGLRHYREKSRCIELLGGSPLAENMFRASRFIMRINYLGNLIM